MQQNPTNNPQALQTIYHSGGHFILCLEDKRPVWRSWQKLRPGLDVVLAHEGPLGLKPWSISTSALDVDAGDPGELMQAWPPMVILDSRRADGKHLYYADTEGRGNGHFEVYGCAGEVRSAKGYLILWHDGAGHLADALHDPVARSRRWPRDLFELAGLPAVTLPGSRQDPRLQLQAQRPIQADLGGGRRSARAGNHQAGVAERHAVRFGPVLGLLESPEARTWMRGRGGCGSTPWSRTGASLSHWMNPRSSRRPTASAPGVGPGAGPGGTLTTAARLRGAGGSSRARCGGPGMPPERDRGHCREAVRVRSQSYAGQLRGSAD